jgi:hypothetical protein
MPASHNASARYRPTKTVSGAGLKTTALPAASAAKTPPAGIESGKFQGDTTATTPNGSGWQSAISSAMTDASA